MMQRTKRKRKPDGILCSDFHLREDTPTCWIGDFQEEQWASVGFVRVLQKTYDCPVLHGGDLFNYWKPSPWLLSMAIKLLPDQFYTVYGQHDLPQHNLDLQEKTGIFCLERAGKIKVLPNAHYGQTPDEYCQYSFHTEHTILVWHHLTYITPPFPGASGGQAEGILRKYPQYDLIVTGDNHQSFWTKYKGRLLVNPGNLTRQKADQIDYRPRVYLWYADTNTVEPVYIPIKEGVITREHIEKKEERDQRIEAFISKLKMPEIYMTTKGWSVTFEQSLEAFFKRNKTKDSIKQIIYNVME